MEVTCKHCKADIDVKFFLSDIKIISEQCMRNAPIDYYASAEGKAICYRCGETIHEHFKTIIDSYSIGKLATEEGRII